MNAAQAYHQNLYLNFLKNRITLGFPNFDVQSSVTILLTKQLKSVEGASTAVGIHAYQLPACSQRPHAAGATVLCSHRHNGQAWRSSGTWLSSELRQTGSQQPCYSNSVYSRLIITKMNLPVTNEIIKSYSYHYEESQGKDKTLDEALAHRFYRNVISVTMRKQKSCRHIDSTIWKILHLFITFALLTTHRWFYCRAGRPHSAPGSSTEQHSLQTEGAPGPSSAFSVTSCVISGHCKTYTSLVYKMRTILLSPPKC